LIRLLNVLAKSGRTIISTIHQPSSEIFLEFDKLMLMVDANVVYNDGARKSIDYFRELGMAVSVHSNLLDHYVKMIIKNKEGITLHYMERVRITKKIKSQKSSRRRSNSSRKTTKEGRPRSTIVSRRPSIKIKKTTTRLAGGQMCYLMKGPS
jgi:ABC-type multidrug transport system ATPase subunit